MCLLQLKVLSHYNELVDEFIIGLSHYNELDNVCITCDNLEDLGAQWGAISKIY